MAAPQAVSTGISLSTGTLLLTGIAIIGIVIYLNTKKKTTIVDIENLSSNKEKYENHKWIIKNAIEKNDKEKIERLSQNKNIMKFDDLAKLIKDFLVKDTDK